MKNIVNSGNALERLKKLIPPGVQPKFTNAAELLAWQREEGLKQCEELNRMNQKALQSYWPRGLRDDNGNDLTGSQRRGGEARAG